MYERCIGIEQFVTSPRFWLNLAFNLLPLHTPIFISILGIVHLSNPLCLLATTEQRITNVMSISLCVVKKLIANSWTSTQTGYLCRLIIRITDGLLLLFVSSAKTKVVPAGKGLLRRQKCILTLCYDLRT